MEYPKKLSLVEHLEELRGRAIKCLLFVLAASILAYSRSGAILELLTVPVGRLVFIAPQEAFIAHIYVSFFFGIVISSPFLLFQVWRFVAGGLSERERKWLILFAPMSFIFLVVGSAFGYFIIIPIGLKFLLGFATDLLTPMISVSRYIAFVGGMILVFGAAFELPIAVLFLTKIGMVSPAFLCAKRKYIVVLIFIAGAFLTPPDVVTQLLLALPLLGLFEISILLSRLVYRERAG
ncbi:twin-arginine translocase subunit TatC [Candidatus Omnitrophota bacterium]